MEQGRPATEPTGGVGQAGKHWKGRSQQGRPVAGLKGRMKVRKPRTRRGDQAVRQAGIGINNKEDRVLD